MPNGNGLLAGMPWWGKVAASSALIIASSFSTIFVRDQFVPPPSDAFGRLNAEIMAYEIRTENQAARAEIYKRMSEIQVDKPPTQTRNRILYIERWIRMQDPMYERPTDEW